MYTNYKSDNTITFCEITELSRKKFAAEPSNFVVVVFRKRTINLNDKFRKVPHAGKFRSF